MKLIIQIPCYNEAQTLPLVFKNMPRSIPGIDIIEYLVIDDSSTDNTAEVAKQLGVHHVVRIRGKNRRWLGRTFKTGIDYALSQGADIVVNTDGDNQYPSAKIADLVCPILNGEVDIVIGDRNPGKFQEFSPMKRLLQSLGSKTIESLTREPVKDAVSGFRAYSREALIKINIMTNYTYTVDTLIQANKKGLDIAWVPITPNKKTRESHLIKSLWDKVKKSGATILRISAIYEPFKTFCYLTVLFLVPAIILLGRFLYFYFLVPGEAGGHIQSVIVGGVCAVIAVQLFVLGIIGDLLSANRCLIEDLLLRIRRIENNSVTSEEPKLPKRVSNL